MTTEIYYLICYDTKSKKWCSADTMLANLNNGAGPVLEGDGSTGKFRPILDGLETDVDYDNIEKLSEFIRTSNEER